MEFNILVKLLFYILKKNSEFIINDNLTSFLNSDWIVLNT